LTMDGQRIGSAKKIFLYHNALILHKSKKQTVKDQFNSFHDMLGYIRRKYCEVSMDRVAGLELIISY
jgi:sulfur relay (sulfurtransferase) complex TusBCD TusD component (DsrE family)